MEEKKIVKVKAKKVAAVRVAPASTETAKAKEAVQTVHPEESSAGKKHDNVTASSWRAPEGFQNIITFALLLIFTFGIYFLYWIYKATQRVHKDAIEPMNKPVVQLLLCMFVPFYYLYWFYKTATTLNSMGDIVDIHADNSVICVVLGLFGLGIVSAILLQDQYNKILCVQSGASVKTTGEAECKHCHTKFPNDLDKCPNCGAEYHKQFSDKAVAICAVAAAVIVFFLLVFSSC